MSEPDEKSLVAQILSSYLSNNTVAPADLPLVIDSVKRAFGGGGATTVTMQDSITEPRSWEPAVSIKKSISPDSIACLVDRI
ncbi:ROS/MUCR transcriptional regulator protein [Roseiarcus fermentans]|uniref:ROS/MUCR transcriptional regulator protein n=1 Tax=Roseiarcus fermentans TaxID=1473586 RepID=A0A366EIM4_9HYPH|nr:MucR family transcriptional regulator [Roseiarcus fermentans]RBP02213.1 ROS/MUCR transcriptional regulator protein [Roseiarcus fermentans]